MSATQKLPEERLADHGARLDADGYTIVEGLAAREEMAELRAVLDPHLKAYSGGRNQFEGFHTRRVYTLPAISRAFDVYLAHPDILALVRPRLWGDCLLTATVAAEVLPGEQAQVFHTDDVFYPWPRPRPAISIGVIWAVDDFTAENGATQVIPGSHRWDDDRQPAGTDLAEVFSRTSPESAAPPQEPEEDIVSAEMPAGSALIFLGTLWHRAGANASDGPRLGVFPQYCAAWARQQENFSLAVPRERAAEMDETMQALLGYSIHPPFMGHVSGRHPRKLLGE